MAKLAEKSRMTAAPERLALRPEEAASVLGLSRPHLYRMLLSGELPSFKSGRARLIRVADIEAWLESRAS